MQFATLLALAVPLVAALPQSATPTTSSAAPSSTADLEAICEAQASSYKDSCPQCLHNCATSSVPDQCYYSVFFTINGIQSQCEAQGGNNCRGQAVNAVCGSS
ncbi:hypothetical protein EV127DRAFT_485941 [Xylaria flabelliformis]|nr:hypothetical protein EV127DRAFT_485941 [Xylaria flabelliformis]KAI0859106.1 hypothetical protein F4860DRAFT_277338 [Xylaria cubensis]